MKAQLESQTRGLDMYNTYIYIYIYLYMKNERIHFSCEIDQKNVLIKTQRYKLRT